MGTTVETIRSGVDIGLLSRHASSVVVVTQRVAGRPWGTTVTSFTSVSAEPPTVGVSLPAGSAAARNLAETERFGITILAAGQADVARHCARRGEPKFIEHLVDTVIPTPAIAGGFAHLDCEVFDLFPVDDHLLVLGRVGAARITDREPLGYHRSSFWLAQERGEIDVE